MTVQVNFGTVDAMDDEELLRATTDTLIEIDISHSDTGGRNAQILAETYLEEIQSRGLMVELVDRAHGVGVESITVSTADE